MPKCKNKIINEKQIKHNDNGVFKSKPKIMITSKDQSSKGNRYHYTFTFWNLLNHYNPLIPLMMTYDFSPTVEISKVKVNNKHLYIVRDDLLAGGTKQRAAAPMLRKLCKEGFDEFVYASPFCGFAQLALAITCHHLGINCTLFCEQDRSPNTSKGRLHEFATLAKKYANRVFIEPNLGTAEEAARGYCHAKSSRYLIPLGFQCEEYTNELKKALEIQWENICIKLERTPTTLWLPVGSGTLSRTFRKVLPPSTKIKCVNVNVLPKDDQRISELDSIVGIELHHLPIPFIEPASDLPPVPSNKFYDAKLWDLIKREMSDGDVWWNVAR